jgi:DNA-binding beta-propeller fold protein YncE
MRVIIRTCAAVLFVVTACAFVPGVRFQAGAQENRASEARFVFDGSWPKLPLPNKWTFGGVTGLAVDNDDVIWVLHRPNDLNDTENFAALDPPQAECCVKAPAVLAFDRQGNLLHSWDTPQGHMIMVDSKDQVWVGSDTFRIYTKPGKLIAEFPRSPQRPAPARQGGPPSPAIPAGTEMLVTGVEGASFDEPAREVYVIDNYLAGRVLVFDMDTYKFKRGWGAYGKPLNGIAPMPRPKYDPKVPLATYTDFLGHVTVLVAGSDVYVADRQANRIQIFTKQGKFVREFSVAPETLGDGSAVGLALTKDGRSLFVGDHMNNVVWLINRQTDKITARIGYLGRNGGGFNALHMVATDSSGNLYTGEVDPNNRVQRFNAR